MLSVTAAFGSLNTPPDKTGAMLGLLIYEITVVLVPSHAYKGG